MVCAVNNDLVNIKELPKTYEMYTYFKRTRVWPCFSLKIFTYGLTPDSSKSIMAEKNSCFSWIFQLFALINSIFGTQYNENGTFIAF